jgi:hypothetical protein
MLMAGDTSFGCCMALPLCTAGLYCRAIRGRPGLLGGSDLRWWSGTVHPVFSGPTSSPRSAYARRITPSRDLRDGDYGAHARPQPHFAVEPVERNCSIFEESFGMSGPFVGQRHS